jgi:hypothetical protein
MQQITDGTTGLGRRIPSDGELVGLVTMELAKNVIANAEFTAYDITKVLRAAQRNLEIDHARVRRAVPTIMAGKVHSGEYFAEDRNYPTGTAILYRPAQAAPTITVTAVPQAQIPAQAGVSSLLLPMPGDTGTGNGQ